MQTVRILQAVVLMLIVALAASCASTKEYTSKLFAPRETAVTDSQLTALRFLDMGDAATNTADWVSTDFILGRDSSNSTAALDNFSRTFPPLPASTSTKPRNDTASAPKESKETILAKAPAAKDEPVVRPGSMTGVRDKRSREE